MSDKPTVIDDEGELAAVGEIATNDEPPVVARLVVEIRSDGSRTIARGALEDQSTGQTVALEARGDSPMQLAIGLAKMIAQAPLLARTAANALLPNGKPKRPSRAARLLRRIRRGRGGGGDR